MSKNQEIEIDPYDKTFVRMMEDPQDGFDLILAGGRAKIAFGLQETKRLKDFLQDLLDQVDKNLKEGHKKVSSTGGNVLSGKVLYNKKRPLSGENMPEEEAKGFIFSNSL